MNQKEKNQYFILVHIYVESKKMVCYFLGRNRDTDVENRCLDMGGGWCGVDELRDWD